MKQVCLTITLATANAYLHQACTQRGFNRTPLNPNNQSRALVRSSQSHYYSHYLTLRAHVVHVGSISKQAIKQNGPGPTITNCFRVLSSSKEPNTDTDDVESEANVRTAKLKNSIIFCV